MYVCVCMCVCMYVCVCVCVRVRKLSIFTDKDSELLTSLLKPGSFRWWLTDGLEAFRNCEKVSL